MPAWLILVKMDKDHPDKCSNTEKFMRGDHIYTLLLSRETKCIMAWETESAALHYMAPQLSISGIINNMTYSPQYYQSRGQPRHARQILPKCYSRRHKKCRSYLLQK